MRCSRPPSCYPTCAGGAFLAIVGQILLGRTLSEPWLISRPVLRRWHFRAMLVLAVNVLGHLLLDRRALRELLRD